MTKGITCYEQSASSYAIEQIENTELSEVEISLALSILFAKLAILQKMKEEKNWQSSCFLQKMKEEKK